MTNPKAPILHQLAPWLLLLLGYGVYALRLGYGFGASDQDEVIPYLQHLLDPTLFTQDWFVQTQLKSFSIRTYFVYLLWLPAQILPLWLSVYLIYLLSWSGVVIALYKLADLLTKNRLTALLATAVIALFTPLWTLGGNDMLNPMLVPSMSAWAIGLWVPIFYLQNRFTAAGLMAGLATLMQALVGLQLFMFMAGLICINAFMHPKELATYVKSTFQAALAFAISSAPALIPLFYQQFTSDASLMSGELGSMLDSSASEQENSLFYIMALFRIPHHYLFHSFDPIRSFKFFLLVLTGFIALLRLQQTRPDLRYDFFFQSIALISVICLAAYIGTEVLSILFIAKLQLFKLTILIKVLMAIALAAVLVDVLPDQVTRLMDKVAWEQPAWMMALFAVLVTGVMILQPHRITHKIYPLSKQQSVEVQIAHWAKDHSHKDEVFAVPPSWSAFRTHAERAIVVNHKAFPYLDADIPVWYNRLLSMAPIKPPERSDHTLISTLDDSYNALSPFKLEPLTYQYLIDYVVRNQPIKEASPLELVYEIDGYYVYKVSPQRMASSIMTRPASQ